MVQLSVLTHEKVTLNQVGDEEANVGDGEAGEVAEHAALSALPAHDEEGEAVPQEPDRANEGNQDRVGDEAEGRRLGRISQTHISASTVFTEKQRQFVAHYFERKFLYLPEASV